MGAWSVVAKGLLLLVLCGVFPLHSVDVFACVRRDAELGVVSCLAPVPSTLLSPGWAQSKHGSAAPSPSRWALHSQLGAKSRSLCFRAPPLPTCVPLPSVATYSLLSFMIPCTVCSGRERPAKFQRGRSAHGPCSHMRGMQVFPSSPSETIPPFLLSTSTNCRQPWVRAERPMTLCSTAPTGSKPPATFPPCSRAPISPRGTLHHLLEMSVAPNKRTYERIVETLDDIKTICSGDSPAKHSAAISTIIRTCRHVLWQRLRYCIPPLSARPSQDSKCSSPTMTNFACHGKASVAFTPAPETHEPRSPVL